MSTPVEGDFWSARHYLFTAKFLTYYTQPQKVWGRFHTSEEQYHASPDEEIIPIKEKKGKRTYVMMQPYVREPNLTLTIGLYDEPKQYADQESPIGEVIESRQEGFKEAKVGNAQAWYYHTDKTIVLWECFFEDRFMKHPLATDINMQHLWKRFEFWLVKKFPKATTLATPFDIAGALWYGKMLSTTTPFSKTRGPCVDNRNRFTSNVQCLNPAAQIHDSVVDDLDVSAR